MNGGTEAVLVRTEPPRGSLAGYHTDTAHDGSLIMVPKVPPRGTEAFHIRVITDPEADFISPVEEIWQADGRQNIDDQIENLYDRLDEGGCEVHIAYADGVPVACARLDYGNTPGFAELAGACTSPGCRGRGFYTALINSRMARVFSEPRFADHDPIVFVDALHTSEPILLRNGFSKVTTTTPYLLYPPEH